MRRSRRRNAAPRRHSRGGLVRALWALVALTGAATPVRAQSLERFTIDSVVEADTFDGDNVSSQPQAIVDVAAAVRIGHRWQLFVRPWIRQPRPGAPGAPTPDADAELYAAGVRYERPGRVATRVEAGYLPSPIGLGILDWRPSDNPTIVPHLSYAVPLLAFDPTVAVRAAVVSNSYPLAAQVTASTTKWDARAAVVNSSPTRFYAVGNATNPEQTPNVVLGAGVTPITGLRVGASFARGAYATGRELADPSADGRQATIAGGEGEYAFGYTSLRGEVLHTTFETATGTAAGTEWFVQGMQILSPRWFGAGRVEHSGGPAVVARGVPLRTDLDMVEATAGFRVNPEVTLRASYYTRRFYAAATWDNQVGVSIVWARRWW